MIIGVMGLNRQSLASLDMDDFLQQNLSQALPSLRTVHRLVYNEYMPITEGQFHFDELEVYLSKHN